MEKQLQRVKSKFKADKTFISKDGYRLAIEPGENWIGKEEIAHLLNTSDGFKYFVNNKQIIIKTDENSIRAETGKEKKLRLSLKEKGQAILKKIKNQKPEAPAASPDTSADLKSFSESLKAESEKELSLFADAVRGKSVKLEEEFLKKSTETIDDSATKIQFEYLEEFGKSADSSLKQFKADIETAATTALNNFGVKLEELVVAKFENFDKRFAGQLKSFDKKIKTAIAKAEKKMNNIT